MKLKFTGSWDKDVQTAFGIPRGYILVRYEPFYRDQVVPFLSKLDDKQQKAKVKNPEDYLKELDFSIEAHYRARNLDQNNLMWALYEIEANEQNGGMSGHDSDMVKPAELYAADISGHGERESVKTLADNIAFYCEEYHVLGVTWKGAIIPLSKLSGQRIEPDEAVTVHYIRGTSKLNTVQMAQWIDRIWNRLAHYGVALENTSEIKDYWVKWQQHKNDNKITYSETIMSMDEYREIHTVCESCGCSTMAGGHLAHIKALGMGADRREDVKVNYSTNWLLLCHTCHLGVQHQKGWEEFLKLFPHLTYKVNTALNRDYDPIPEAEPELDIF